MDDLRKIKAFVDTVERKGFTGAARQADVAVSSVARQVKALEEELGTRLLNRTTRSQSLTETGRVFYERIRDLLRDIEAAKRDVLALSGTVAGTLTVTIRTSTSGLIIPVLPLFLENHPAVTLDLSVTDERLDLVANGIDVAVWLGEMRDSSLVGRRLSGSRRLLCGSPGYFRRAGEPTSPEELVDHNCLIYRAKQYHDCWKFVRGEDASSVKVSGNLRSASGSVLMGSAVAGLGLVLVQEFHARPMLEAGLIRPVLDDYDISPTDEDTSLYLVYPSARGLSPACRAFLDFMIKIFE